MIFSVERTARKSHFCDSCGRSIKPGERYVDSAITPQDEYMGDADGKRWGRFRSHGSTRLCYPEVTR